MPDVFDMAQDNDHFFRIAAISSQLARARVARQHAPTVICVDCGGEIDEARRRVAPNAIRCIKCQTKHERIYGRQA